MASYAKNKGLVATGEVKQSLHCRSLLTRAFFLLEPFRLQRYNDQELQLLISRAAHIGREREKQRKLNFYLRDQKKEKE
ncbi:ABC transporter G family member 42 [Corchorus olitorius]|uniref:ABC transporter G family member 42 n=1 Tax=Corchorus olitorius TaxID=93759 RepID=A0A1R3K8X8_9ROSI|nr:ABC transporter G family member 42 [Corchorus olitorius]